ncbi:MAG: hypothetical protein HQL16_05225 [Candidatus Omnitrophica bacterium]|nr:hypothetical protein [Candidatus Omnitrophota bacterium]
MMHSLVFSFAHAVIVLTVSFFVLLAIHKLEASWLRTFGYVIAALLWVSAALVLGKGLHERHHFGGHERMMMCPMMKREMPPMGKQCPFPAAGPAAVNK